MSTNVLVFSRDRAMQLDAVLRSLFLHCKDCKSFNVSVLYYANSGLHSRQYELLKTEYPHVAFISQNKFRADLLGMLDPFSAGSFTTWVYNVTSFLILGMEVLERLPLRMISSISLRLRTQILQRTIPSPSEDSYLLFLVDDNIFVQDFSISKCIQALQSCHDALGMSLRLGTNITHCYTVDQSQPQPKMNPIQNGILKFDWTTSEFDFGYPLEVSSSIYRIRDIFPVIAIQPFNNPNELEYQLAVSANKFSQQMPYLLCPTQSYTFCNPVNIVQKFASNRAGSNAEYTNENLATLFDQGYRVNVSAYSGFVPEGCHQEVPLEFFRPETGAA